MGTDIHGWVEYRCGGEAPWQAGAALAPLITGREYGGFGCLFGVRNGDNFRPVAADRGFPPDTSDIVRDAYADAQRELGIVFGASWLRYAEWTHVDWDERAADPALWRHVTHGRVGRPGYRPWGAPEYDDPAPAAPRPTRREALAEDWWQPVIQVMSLLAGRHGDRNVRLVVWFDN